jgi:hypothetical protein
MFLVWPGLAEAMENAVVATTTTYFKDNCRYTYTCGCDALIIPRIKNRRAYFLCVVRDRAFAYTCGLIDKGIGNVR